MPSPPTVRLQQSHTSPRTYSATGSRRLLDSLTVIPGVMYNSIWHVVPKNALEVVQQELEGAGAKVVVVSRGNPPVSPPELPTTLRPYQKEAAERALLERAYGLFFEMRTGKTPTACSTLRAESALPALIVCPAIVRQTWLDHIQDWWPEAHSQAVMVERGLDAELPGAVYISSFELAGKVPPRKWAAIIVDEVHYLKNKTAARSKAVQMHLDAQDPAALRLFLTGTPVANEPIDLWGQLNALEPNCWGTELDFKRRYCQTRPNPYAYSGVEYYGLNPDTAEELHTRLQAISTRITKMEVAHMLPPLTVECVRVKSKGVDLHELLQRFAREDKHRQKVDDDLIRASSEVKTETILELVKDAKGSGAKWIAVMTHLRATAETLGAVLGGTVITGKDTTAARHKKLKALRAKESGILVATMHSLETGISLGDFTEVIYAELCHKPNTVSQSMARFHEVNGGVPVHIRVVVLEGTLEEKVVASVLRKTKAIDKTVGAGAVEGGLIEGLKREEKSDADMLAELRQAATSMIERDGYG